MSDQSGMYWAAVRSDAMVFMQQAFTTIYPGKSFMPNWHIDAIVDALEDSLRGAQQRLIINLPPRHLKSFIASVAWPAFILGHDPTAKVICVSYSDELAKTLSRDFKRIVLSPWYQRVFAHVKPTKTTESEVVTTEGGFRFATSVGGTLTGRGSDFIILDDPIKPDDALSDKARQSVNDWYRTTLLSRLDDKQRSALILIMQRLHVNDLTGYVEANAGFKKLSFPAIALRDELIRLRHGQWYRRRLGEALQPDRENIDVLHGLRDQMGAFTFASQYQQTPEAPEGTLFKRSWFKFITVAPQRDPHGRIYVSIDCAASTRETADYSALSVVYANHGKFSVLFGERGRWDYETLKAKALVYFKRYGDKVTFVVENASMGIALITYLRNEGISCFSNQPSNSKLARAIRALPIVESGRVEILDMPNRNAWVTPYVNEILSFPHGRFDDQVDSLMQLLPWADGRNNGRGRVWEIF